MIESHLQGRTMEIKASIAANITGENFNFVYPVKLTFTGPDIEKFEDIVSEFLPGEWAKDPSALHTMSDEANPAFMTISFKDADGMKSFMKKLEVKLAQPTKCAHFALSEDSKLATFANEAREICTARDRLKNIGKRGAVTR